MHLFFMTCITGFTFFSIIVSHNYPEVRDPGHHRQPSPRRVELRSRQRDPSRTWATAAPSGVTSTWTSSPPKATPSRTLSASAVWTPTSSPSSKRNTCGSTRARQRTVHRACPGGGRDGVRGLRGDDQQHHRRFHRATGVDAALADFQRGDDVRDEPGARRAQCSIPSGGSFDQPVEESGAAAAADRGGAAGLAGPSSTRRPPGASGTAAVYTQARAASTDGTQASSVGLVLQREPRPMETLRHHPSHGRHGEALAHQRARGTQRPGHLPGRVSVGSSLQAHSQTRVERDWAGFTSSTRATGTWAP